MNRFVLTSIAAAVMAIGTSGAIAQSPSTTGTGSSSSMTPSTPATTRSDAMSSGKTMNNSYSGMRDSQAWERTHRVSKIIGMDVVNSKGEKVGDVEDIVLDDKGNIAYAVVSTGGFLGMGEKMHAVPWSSMRTSTGTDNYMLDIDRERLRTAPGFDKNTWPNVNDAKWSSQNRTYFPASGTTRSSNMSNTTSSNSSMGTNSNSMHSGSMNSGSTNSGSMSSNTTGAAPVGTSGRGPGTITPEPNTSMKAPAAATSSGPAAPTNVAGSRPGSISPVTAPSSGANVQPIGTTGAAPVSVSGSGPGAVAPVPDKPATKTN